MKKQIFTNLSFLFALEKSSKTEIFSWVWVFPAILYLISWLLVPLSYFGNAQKSLLWTYGLCKNVHKTIFDPYDQRHKISMTIKESKEIMRRRIIHEGHSNTVYHYSRWLNLPELVSLTGSFRKFECNQPWRFEIANTVEQPTAYVKRYYTQRNQLVLHVKPTIVEQIH